MTKNVPSKMKKEKIACVGLTLLTLVFWFLLTHKLPLMGLELQQCIKEIKKVKYLLRNINYQLLVGLKPIK